MAPALSPADRAALENLARREDDVGLHARIALGAAAGGSVSLVARECRAARETVRKWMRRFAAEGVPGLYARKLRIGVDASGAPLARVAPVAVPQALLRPAQGGGPLSPSARLRIECAVRHAAACGAAPPGAALPSRAWFAGRFKASCAAVNAAFSALKAQEFVEAHGRQGTRLAARPPFDGRFLLLLEERNADGTSGLCDNLERAARETERARPGVRWDVAWRDTRCDAPANRELAAALATHRWCGAFLRIAHPTTREKGWSPGADRIASVPHVPLAADRIYPGTEVSPLARELNVGRTESVEEAMALCQRRGWRRVVLADTWSKTADMEQSARAAARAAGVEIPDAGYVSPSPKDRAEAIRRLFGFQMRLVGPGDADAILVRRDDLLRPVAEALRAHWGPAAAARVPVVCWSVGPFLPDEGLNVEWRGPDLVASLLSFMDWCASVRAGNPAPPPPRVVPR